MSQEEIRQLLAELNGRATQQEISKLAREQYPNRTLDKYVENFLKLMLSKGLVENVSGTWVITDQGSNSKIEHTISELDAYIDEDNLERDCDLIISNLVGSLRLGRELDLESLNRDLENTEYHPETYPSMIYRPSIDGSLSILTPRTGRLAIVGAKSKQEIIEGVDNFFKKLSKLGINIDRTASDILVQNIVGNFDMGREIDLSTVSIALGLENIEYEPEQFPGVIYRGGGNSTILLFNSGKCVITGAKSYLELVQSRDDIIKILSESGLELNLIEYCRNKSEGQIPSNKKE